MAAIFILGSMLSTAKIELLSQTDGHMISFQAEEVKFPFKGKNRYKNWIKTLAGQYQKRVGELNYIFLTDEGLLTYNQTYLNHQTYTDIITFDTSEEDHILAGDIFISVDRIKENAQKFQVSEEKELLRVMAHGVLHLCGFRDKKKTEIEAMRQAEEQAIQLFFSLA